jgi:formylglycine-generating enzyme
VVVGLAVACSLAISLDGFADHPPSADAGASPDAHVSESASEETGAEGGSSGAEAAEEVASGGMGGIGGLGGMGGAGATAGNGETGGTAGTSRLDGSAGSGQCRTICGPLEECSNAERCVAKLVAAAGSYSIDVTEATVSQYEAWLATHPPTSGQPAYCSWNESFTPIGEWPRVGMGQYPVANVDWCDSYAYCIAAGKRLCGKIGGGANRFSDNASPGLSQWYRACSSNNQNDYPYGDTYVGTKCNGSENNVGAAVQVGTLLQCQSSVAGYSGVYDLSGNVWEWEDSCDAANGEEDECRVRGGSYVNPGNALRCDDGNYDTHRAGVYPYLGFRCCSN